VSGLKRFSTCFLRGCFRVLPGTGDTLLTKPNELYTVAGLGEDSVRFGFMLRGSLWFIVAAESFRAALYGHFLRFLPPFFFALAAAFMPDFVYGYFLPRTIGIIYLLKKELFLLAFWYCFRMASRSPPGAVVQNNFLR